MERLTKRTANGKVAYALLQSGECVDPIDLLRVWGDRLAAYEDTMTLERAQELSQAEKDGRLVVLPCKPGTDVYISRRRATVKEFFGYRTERYLQAQFYDNAQYTDIPFEEIGKTVFLTREEAEEALKKRE